MSFEAYEPRRIEPLPVGWCSLNSAGAGRFWGAELRAAGVNGKVAVLLDKGNLRIALRKPRPGETPLSVFAKAGDTVHINLRGAVRALGLTPAAVAGRYELQRKNDLLVINLTSTDGGV